MLDARYKWLIVGLLWVVALLNYLDRQIIFSVFPLLEKDLHVSSTQLGLLGTAFLWIYGLLSPFGGYFADRYSRRRVIFLSLAVWSIVTWLTGFARDYWQLVAARALMGISEAFYLPAALALINDYHSDETRSRATGLHQSGLYMGIVLGGVGGGWMGELYGWRMAFYILGAVGVFYSLLLLVQLHDNPKQAAHSGSIPFSAAMRDLASCTPFVLLVCANSLISVGYWCVYTWLPTFLYERFHASLTVSGFTSTFYIQAASFAGILTGGTLADRWVRTESRGRLFTQAIGISLAAPFLFLIGSTSSWWILIAALLCFGLGRGFFDCNVMPVVCQMVSPRLRASAYGLLNCTSCIVGGLMAYIGGVMRDSIGLSGALQFSALTMLAAAAILVTVKPHASIAQR
ncbi:MAG: MFS transporter [Acidobacteria bacterium]|nr:MFS transporter [Acidobacteriota bacterium]